MLSGLYVPHCSPVHRLPAAVKLAIVAGAGLGVFFVGDPALLGLLFCVTAALAPLARLPVQEVARRFAPFLVLILVFLAFHAAFVSLETGLVVIARFAIMILLGLVLGMTTRLSDLVAAVENLLEPLRPLGVSPERVGLVLSMTIRFMPLVAEAYTEIAAAQKARGLERNVLALMIPLLVRLLQRADDISDALVARGFGDNGRDREN